MLTLQKKFLHRRTMLTLMSSLRDYASLSTAPCKRQEERLIVVGVAALALSDQDDRDAS